MTIIDYSVKIRRASFCAESLKLPEVTNMNSDKCTRTRDTEQALAVGTNVDKMTNPAARMDTMLDNSE